MTMEERHPYTAGHDASVTQAIPVAEALDDTDFGRSLLACQPQRDGTPLHAACSSSSVSQKCKPWQELDFRQMPIIPTKEELLHQANSIELPINKIHGEKYDNLSEYLATHFFLLREDCMQNLCQGVQALSQRKMPPDRLDLQLYRDARLSSICCGKFGIEYRLSFPQEQRLIEMSGSSKCLMEGSLVCMSDDGFQTFAWGIVSHHRKLSVEGDFTHIRFLDNVASGRLDYNRRYTLVESPHAFFEAYCHVLGNLQKPEMSYLPFGEHLVLLEPQVDVPDYLATREGTQLEYDFSCVFPEMGDQLEPFVFPVLQQWPTWKSSLDPSQIEAVKHGITKRLALIQGPPGTGKTFVGTIIVKILLNNLWRHTRAPSVWEQDWDTNGSKRIKLEVQEGMDGPLLILCYTNHALDQFLEGVLQFEQNLIRYGGRSTSSKLAGCAIKQRFKKERRGLLRGVWNRHRLLCGQSDRMKRDISRCHAILRLDHVTLEPLREVASPEQIESLYFCGHDTKVLQLWLQGLDMQSTYHQIQGEKLENVSTAAMDAFGVEPEMVLNEDTGSSEDLNLEEPYVWTLNRSSRKALHNEWLKRIKVKAENKLCELTKQYQSLCTRKTELDEEIQHMVLKGARVVGMTTTAAARCHSLLMRLKPRVLIIEEAAEILEGHVIACLTPFTQHLILIGDHLQLRPSVAVNKLATDHNLDVSLFERLVSGGVEHVTLKHQRRMRPCISRLLHSIYPALKDHNSVFGHKNVEGLLKNVFFLDHRSQEQRVMGSRSKVNVQESLFVVELYLYILKQGFYKPSDVTILTMYRAQMHCIRNMLHERAESVHCLPTGVLEALLRASAQITCVDDFQGEESNIIILSLVRNVCSEKDAESIGFLDNSNRVCVALSRAREGLYIFGNANLLSSRSELWRKVVDDLREVNAVGSYLTLLCPNHFLVKTTIHEAQDFQKVIDGGCGRSCDYTLDCGHKCPRACHPGGHEQALCPQRCRRVLRCQHECMLKCHGHAKCPPCQQMVSRLHPLCRHRVLVPCSSQQSFQCEEPCGSILMCGHKCAQKCGQVCTRWCTRRVDKTLPCGHVATVPCYQPAHTYFCQEHCGQSFEPLCRHRCQGKCSSCKRTKVHPQCCKPCEKILPCGHQCKSLCYQTCEPCAKPCENACRHRRCQRTCGDLCQPCEEVCEWNCEHFRCDLKCHEVCNRPRCNEKCPKVLKCGHDCIGLCGEPCPIRCRVCNPNIVEICSQLPLKEMEASTRFVELSDCGHLAEYNMLDALIDMHEPAAVQVHSTTWPKSCPKCKTPIRRTVRYKGVINSILMNLEEFKKLIINRNHQSTSRYY